MTLNNTTTTIPTQPDRPTLGYFADVESAKYRLMSDGGQWEKDAVTYPMTCPVDDVTICYCWNQHLCESCQIFERSKGDK